MLSLFLLLNFSFCAKASQPGIDINVVPMPDIANNYGGVDIDISINNIKDTNYIYEIKRSEDIINWQNIGIAFDYNFSTGKVVPRKLNVLNVYPDNESFTMPTKLKEKYPSELISTIKNIYSVPSGTFRYKNNSTSKLPRSSMLKIWLEGGEYNDGKQNISYSDLSYYKGKKMYKINQMSMKEFNSNIKSVEQLQNYDILFFGTWDANAWNDLSNSAYSVVRDFIISGHGVIFGHDTISYEITSGGKFTNQCEADNFFKLRSFLGFTSIPTQYEDASLIKANAGGHFLPEQYQIWGGNNAERTVTVRFSKSKFTADSSLPTFPYNLLGADGKTRELEVPITHTSWMGLIDEGNNIVSFAKNEYEILPEAIKKKYNSNPSYRYNWYLCSGKKNYSCYSIQTGHMRNTSSEDERKLIANVICSAYKKEKIVTTGNMKKSKIDTSAQDYNSPKVEDIQLNNSNPQKITVSFKGRDFGTDYYYYAQIKSLDTGKTSKSDITNVTVTTGIKNYYYIVDSDNTNRDFNIDKSNKVSIKENDAGFEFDDINSENIYLHVKAIDYAGNVSAPIVIDLSKKITYGLQELQIKAKNENYLHRASDKDGVRHYYVNGNYDFNINGGCFLHPFASINMQPYCNKINGLTISTPCDSKIGENKFVSSFAGKISDSLSVKSVTQKRTNKSSCLSFNAALAFTGESDGTEVELKPYGLFMQNSKIHSIMPDNIHKLIVTCDKNGPLIASSNISGWYNGYNYKDAFIMEITQFDNCSGVKEGSVILEKYDNSMWKIISSKKYYKYSQKFMFLNSIGEGIYKYEIVSNDNVGNSSNVSKAFYVDRLPPVIHGLKTDYGWTNQNIEISISATDNMSGVSKISLYDKDNTLIKQSLGSIFQYEFCEEQNKSYYVIAEDNAGNISDKYIFNIKIDKTKPNIYGDNLTDEVLSIIDNKYTYYVIDNKINVTATDDSNNGICSGIQSVLLKNQDNQVINNIINNNNSEALQINHDVTDYKLSDFYCVIANDIAGNSRKIYIVPECCQKNRIRRYINHDNYEQEYGYFRVYE